MRWEVEVFFKASKSLLKLGTEYQGRNYDMLISHTAIAFTRYIFLEWGRRHNQDSRSFGGAVLPAIAKKYKIWGMKQL